jgi:pyruvate-formate lyase-activating enzyme
MKVDPIERALQLRKTLISDGKVLVADFSNTMQGKDTSRILDLMPIVGTDFYPFRTKANVKELDPLGSQAYGTDFFDVSGKSDEEIEAFVRKQEFDFALWFKNENGFKMKDVDQYNLPFILQIAGCNFHDGSQSGGCRYCFVDDKSNDGLPGEGKVYLTAQQTLDSMVNARKKVKAQYAELDFDMDLKVLRTSGGEPTIALDWILNLWRAVEKRGLDVVGQLDSNLSTGHLVDDFEGQGIYELNILEKLAEYPIKVLTALKGVDERNLQANVQSTATISEQEYSLRRFIKAGFEIFPQLYNPNPRTLKAYLERMDILIDNFSLKVHIGPLTVYRPNARRLGLEARACKKDPYDFMEEKKELWASNYKRSCEVMDKYLRQRHGVGYKEVTRSDVELKLR